MIFRVQNTDLFDDPNLPVYSEDGVDLTLIREMLALTVNERLAYLEEHARFMQEARDARIDVPVPLDKLIEVKEAAGRPKDVAVLPTLRQTLLERRRFQ